MKSKVEFVWVLGITFSPLDGGWTKTDAVKFEASQGDKLPYLEDIDQKFNSPLSKIFSIKLHDGRVAEFVDLPSRNSIPAKNQLAPVQPLETQVGGSHYKKMQIQPLEFVIANGLDAFQKDILKYICRNKTDRIEDLKKALHYLEIYISVLQDNPNWPNERNQNETGQSI